MLTDDRPDHPTELEIDLDLGFDVELELGRLQNELVPMGALPPYTTPRGGFFG